VTGGVGYLLDTNILSETRRTRPEPKVTDFLSATDASALYISVLSLGELRKGVEIKRRTHPDEAARIGAWVDGTEHSFADRILPVDAAVAGLWGRLSADRSRPVIDTLIAATALTHGLILVTRNVVDLSGIEISILDPWMV
jgi:predicted nucleic acid-binding protein